MILGIESSCDDTSASVFENDFMLSNCIAGQEIHRQYGGVVPELASRAHQKNIVPVTEAALGKAGIKKEQLSAIAYTRGPGLIGSLLVGSSFAKGLALALNIPLLEVNHMQAHVMAHFIRSDASQKQPAFPFLCLTVSGGHTQIVLVSDYLKMEVLGETLDDAAGEAFDKAAKIMGLPYPGGPLVDKLAKEGNPLSFVFPHPKAPGLNFSFSGLKTSFLYFVNNELKKDNDFIQKNKANLSASIQKTIIDILIAKLRQASRQTGIKEIALAGGVSANSGLRHRLLQEGLQAGWNVYIPELQFCTDNAAMIALTGYYKMKKGQFSTQEVSSTARYPLNNR